MKRLIAISLLLFAAFASTAAAEKPIKEALTASDFDYPDFICGFTVHTTVLAANGAQKTFSNGRIILTGTYKARLTNVENGKSIDVNASGPAFFTFGDDGSITARFTGRTLFNLFPGDLGPGSPGMLVLWTGPATATLGADGSFSLDHSHGTSQDICAALE